MATEAAMVKKFKFVSYYKFVFTFKSEDEIIIIGGDADSIYRLEVLVDNEYTAEELIGV